MPRLQAARREYSTRLKSIQQDAERQARADNVPPKVRAAFISEDQNRIREAFMTWVTERIEADPEVKAISDPLRTGDERGQCGPRPGQSALAASQRDDR